MDWILTLALVTEQFGDEISGFHMLSFNICNTKTSDLIIESSFFLKPEAFEADIFQPS